MLTSFPLSSPQTFCAYLRAFEGRIISAWVYCNVPEIPHYLCADTQSWPAGQQKEGQKPPATSGQGAAGARRSCSPAHFPAAELSAGSVAAGAPAWRAL